MEEMITAVPVLDTGSGGVPLLHSKAPAVEPLPAIPLIVEEIWLCVELLLRWMGSVGESVSARGLVSHKVFWGNWASPCPGGMAPNTLQFTEPSPLKAEFNWARLKEVMLSTDPGAASR